MPRSLLLLLALLASKASAFVPARTTKRHSLVAFAEPPPSFEPQLPPTETLIGMAGIVILSAVSAWAWAELVVPVSRTNLARSKRSGDVKEYLDELKEDGDDRSLERWLFSDWLQGPSKKPAAIPVLKKAKWNSGDNPVLVASALIMAGVLATSLAERAGNMI